MFPSLPLRLLLLGLSWAALPASAGAPVIRLRDPRDGAPILEGSNVTLECLSEEEREREGNASRLSFHKFGQWIGAWLPLEAGARLPCWFYGVALRHEPGRLLLSIAGAQPWHNGAYRCLSAAANDTGSRGRNASASAKFELRVEYLHGVFLSRADSWCGTLGEAEPVREGQDLELRCSAEASQEPLYEWSREGEDWVVASSSLVLRRFSREQAGTYTCRARHPSVAQLDRSRSLRLLVAPPEWAAAHGLAFSLSSPTLALAVALPAFLLLLLVAAFAFLIMRRQAAAKAKAPREEPGQRTPIYKGSLESVAPTAGDTQPLVM